MAEKKSTFGSCRDCHTDRETTHLKVVVGKRWERSCSGWLARRVRRGKEVQSDWLKHGAEKGEHKFRHWHP
jgi:hypothetical protein